MNDFEIGDIVKLRSGGPNMTVKGKKFDQNNLSASISTIWFDLQGVLHEGSFNPDILDESYVKKEKLNV